MSVVELMAPPQPQAPFNLGNEYVWVQCALTDYRDFWAEVRLDLTNGERRALKTRHDELTAQRQAIEDRVVLKEAGLRDRHRAAFDAGDAGAMAAIAGEQIALNRDRDEARWLNQAAIYELIAPYIRNWNAVTPGTTEIAPAPQAVGIAAFDAINDVLGNWLYLALMTAYQGNGFRRPATTTNSMPSAEPAEPTKKPDEPTSTDEQPDSCPSRSRASRTNSRGHSQSA